MSMTPEQATAWIFDLQEAYTKELQSWRKYNIGDQWVAVDDMRSHGFSPPTGPEPVDVSYRQVRMSDEIQCNKYIQQCALLAAIDAYEGLR